MDFELGLMCTVHNQPVVPRDTEDLVLHLVPGDEPKFRIDRADLQCMSADTDACAVLAYADIQDFEGLSRVMWDIEQ